MLQNFNFNVLAEAAVFVYFSYLAGDLIISRFRFELTPIQKTVYRILVGFGLFANIGLALALAGRFSALPLRLVFFALPLLAFSAVSGHVRAVIAKASRPFSFAAGIRGILRGNTALKLIVLVWVGLNFLVAFAPITGTDAKAYHLPIIFDLITHGRLTFDASVRYYHELPLLAEVFYAVPTAVFGRTSAPFVFQLLQYFVLVLALLLLYDFSSRLAGDRLFSWGLMAGVLALFDFQREIMHGGYIDVFVFLFGLASTLLVMDNVIRRELKSAEIVLSAVFLGIAASMKYLALFFLLAKGLFLLGHAAVNRSQALKTFKLLALSGLIILAVAGYWYARNAVWFGNPVYPMFSSEEFRTSVGWFSVERTPLNFFLFPFLRFGQWFADPDETSSRLVVLGYFAAFYIFLFSALVRKKLTAPQALVSIFIQLYISLAFFTTHQIRFLLPALIFLPLAIVLFLDDLAAGFGRALTPLSSARFFSVLRFGAIIFALVMFLGNFHYFHIRYLYTAGIYSEEQYIGSIGSQ